MVNCKDASASLAAGTALMMRHARISHTRDASALTKISVLRVGVLGTASSAMSRTSNFELRQPVCESTWWNPKTLVNSFGDQRYLVFYESFPDEESTG